MSTNRSIELAPSDRDLARQHLAGRLYDLMKQRGWRQADLVTHSGLKRDAISAYCGGRAFPNPRNLESLAHAFGVTVEDLVPVGASPQPTRSSVVEISMHPNGRAWIRIDRMVTSDTATQILQLLKTDETPN